MDDTITKSETLVKIRQAIVDGHARATRGDAEWVEGTLQMAEALYSGRALFESDQEYGAFLESSGLGACLNKNDRAALIHLGSNIEYARFLLTTSKSRCIQLIWSGVEYKNRFPTFRKPRSENRTKHPKENPESPAPRPEPHDGRIITQCFVNDTLAIQQYALDLNGHEVPPLTQQEHSEAIKHLNKTIEVLQAILASVEQRKPAAPALKLVS